MPIQIEAEHPPLQLVWELRPSHSFSRNYNNVYLFHASVYSERAMYRSVRIDCSAVASFPCSHCDLRYLNRSLFARQNQLSAHAASSDIAKGRAGFRTSPLQCAMGLVSRTKVQTFPLSARRIT